MADRKRRGIFLTVITVLFVLLALSDFTKAFQFVNDPATGGLVVFGHKFHGIAPNLILGPMFGLVLLIYAYGIWNLRLWVLPLSMAYAFYVPHNAVLFAYLRPAGPPSIPFIVGWLAIALTGSVGTALYLASHRERLT